MSYNLPESCTAAQLDAATADGPDPDAQWCQYCDRMRSKFRQVTFPNFGNPVEVGVCVSCADSIEAGFRRAAERAAVKRVDESLARLEAVWQR